MYKNQPLSVARYSFTQLSELWQCSVNKFVQCVDAEAAGQHATADELRMCLSADKEAGIGYLMVSTVCRLA